MSAQATDSPLKAQERSAGAPDTQRVLAYPKSGTAYTERLYAEVEARQVTVVEGVWSGRWLRRNVRSGDIIHIHWPSFLYFDASSKIRTAVRLAKLYAYLWFARMLGAKLVWTAHNLYPHDGFDRKFHRIGRRIITSLANYVCVHGPSSAQLVERELKVAAARIRIAHHGHWLGHYPNQITRGESRARLNLPAGEFVYLFIGACRPYKGLESLIEAFAAMPRPARLLIAGKFTSPHYLDEIQALVRKTPAVELVPESIPDDELQLYLNAADCVVLPYRAILTSGTAMLAMSFGRPVVAPDLGGITDHLDFRCGLLYDADDPQGLTNALLRIRSLSFESAAIIENARRFGWSQLVGALLEVPGGPAHSSSDPQRLRTS